MSDLLNGSWLRRLSDGVSGRRLRWVADLWWWLQWWVLLLHWWTWRRVEVVRWRRVCTGHCCGCELLVRWLLDNNGTRRTVSIPRTTSAPKTRYDANDDGDHDNQSYNNASDYSTFQRTIIPLTYAFTIATLHIITETVIINGTRFSSRQQEQADHYTRDKEGLHCCYLRFPLRLNKDTHVPRNVNVNTRTQSFPLPAIHLVSTKEP